jgi:hypothetical protein
MRFKFLSLFIFLTGWAGIANAVIDQPSGIPARLSHRNDLISQRSALMDEWETLEEKIASQNAECSEVAEDSPKVSECQSNQAKILADIAAYKDHLKKYEDAIAAEYSQFIPDQKNKPQTQEGVSYSDITSASDKRLALQNALEKASQNKDISKKGACNFYVSDVGRSLNIPYFRRFGHRETDDKRMANQMYSFLEKAVKDPKSGWIQVNAEEAGKLANKGEFVVAAAKNKSAPDEISRGGTRVDFADMEHKKVAHGHIGIVAPDSMKINPKANTGTLPLIRDSAHPGESVRANYTFGSLSSKADPNAVDIEKPIYVHWKGVNLPAEPGE